MKLCQLLFQLVRKMQSASPFPPAIFANVGLMFVVCDVYLVLSQALPRGIAVDVARARGSMEMRCGTIRTNRYKSNRTSEIWTTASCCGRSARLIRSQEHYNLFCSSLDHYVYYTNNDITIIINHGRHTGTEADCYPPLVSPAISLRSSRQTSYLHAL